MTAEVEVGGRSRAPTLIGHPDVGPFCGKPTPSTTHQLLSPLALRPLLSASSISFVCLFVYLRLEQVTGRMLLNTLGSRAYANRLPCF